MSIADVAGPVAGFLSPALSFLSIGPSRNFAGFSGYVTLSESTTDAIEITQQPVQQGASIADHFFKKPVNLSIQIQFGASGNPLSLAASAAGAVGGNLLGSSSIAAVGAVAATGTSLLAATGLFGSQSLSQVYQNLLNLQTNGMPFTVNTLKRSYPNMLLATLGVTTDKKTENTLAITASFQEVIIVPIGSANVPVSQLANAASNAATQNVGKKSAALVAAQGFNPNIQGFSR
jgi:hypothetical protein